jgi:choline dehydrogenase-like flavoprotein
LPLRAGAVGARPSIRGAPGARTIEEIPAMVSCFGAAALLLVRVHLFSSIPMGERDTDSVDSFGRLKALANVWVNDASILPTAPGVKPQRAILALARRNTVRWLEDGVLRG